MSSNEYFKQYKAEMEKQQFRQEILDEVRIMVQTSMEQIKNDILGAVNREIDISVNALMDGKQIGSFNIGELVADNVFKHWKSSI